MIPPRHTEIDIEAQLDIAEDMARKHYESLLAAERQAERERIALLVDGWIATHFGGTKSTTLFRGLLDEIRAEPT